MYVRNVRLPKIRSDWAEHLLSVYVASRTFSLSRFCCTSTFGRPPQMRRAPIDYVAVIGWVCCRDIPRRHRA
jgi:hypothetical protein